MCASSASQVIGADSTLGWVMLTGLVIVIPPTALLADPAQLSPGVLGLLAAAGAANVTGLLLEYLAFRRGKVGVITAIASAEGMVAAVISAVTGARLSLTTGLLLGLVTLGVAITAASDSGALPREDTPEQEVRYAAPGPRRRTMPWSLLAVSAALMFGVSLYSTGRAGQQVPVLWALLPARLFGSVLIAAPLAARRRLRLTRRALPLVVAAGSAEVLGALSYTIGARHDLAVAAVLAAQLAALTAVAAYFIHGQRLSRRQLAGLVAVVVGVTLLSAISPLPAVVRSPGMSARPAGLSPPTTQPIAELAGNLPVGVSPGDCLPLVKGPPAARQGDLHLHPAVPEVQRQRHQRDAGVAQSPDNLADLAAVQEQLASAPGLIQSAGAMAAVRVLGDVQAVEHQLAVVLLDECIDQRRLAGAQGLHLVTDQDYPGLVRLEDRVVVPRPPVRGDEPAARFPARGDLLVLFASRRRVS
jgi:drug/metabolite transporter (DMT)-like permease